MALSAGLGARVRRREDPRLVTGAGTYVGDLSPTGLCYLVFVRSYLPHAIIGSVDVAAARSSPGVIAVVTATDMEGMPSFAQSGPRGSRLPDRPLLNARKVHFIGDLIGFVVAETLDQARDAADLIRVELEALPAVVDPLRAADADTPIIHDELETNLADKTSRLCARASAINASPVFPSSRAVSLPSPTAGNPRSPYGQPPRSRIACATESGPSSTCRSR
jgi:carbon-monoxide dehydrogenase large subunit